VVPITWQGVPWAVSGANHPVEVGRLLAHIATDGAEGVVGPGDCQVRALAVPGAGFRVMPGAIAAQNKFPGGGHQAYLMRNPDEDVVTITPTGSGGGRTDLVAAIVEDPQYPGQPAPASVTAGPYVRTRVYTNVDAGVKTMTAAQAMAAVAPTQTGVALAAYTLGTSDGTLDQADIVDLRAKLQSQTRVYTRMLNVPNGTAWENLTTAAFSTFPNSAAFDVPVPSWATKVGLELHASGIEVFDGSTGTAGDWNGQSRVTLGTIATASSEVRPPTSRGPGTSDTFSWLCAGEVPVPKAMRGTTQRLRSEALRGGSVGGMVVRATWGTTVVARAIFSEDVDSTFWDV
jgi:hypothetical protein